MATIVIKFGTSSITDEVKGLNKERLNHVVEDISTLHKVGHRIILVSSGAVGNGKNFLPHYKGSVNDRKAAAAIGNPILINTYAKIFQKHGIVIAQTLLERWHFSKRKHFLQLRDTITTLWENQIIPIANENDVVSDLEIRFSDNDQLATLLAAGFGADHLLIASTVEGILDDEGKVIREITNPEATMKNFIKDEKSSLGLGGMATKLSYANLAANLGIETTIFGLKKANPITRALNKEIGSTFPSKTISTKARDRWLVSGSLASGVIEVDAGAMEAIKSRKSLLLVGVTMVIEHFAKGEIMEVKHKSKTIGVGISRISSEDINLDKKSTNTVVIHANDLVLL
jgi:glutamate 5-kinase